MPMPTPSIAGSTLTVSRANGVLANDTNADGGALPRYWAPNRPTAH